MQKKVLLKDNESISVDSINVTKIFVGTGESRSNQSIFILINLADGYCWLDLGSRSFMTDNKSNVSLVGTPINYHSHIQSAIEYLMLRGWTVYQLDSSADLASFVSALWSKSRV
jgi:hypothetical protein